VGNSLRDLRRKMKGIKATRQVTKAMELVAASKMRRAVSNAVTLRRYALASWHILLRVSKRNPEAHAALRPRPVKNVLGILFTSDRGLTGSMGTQILKTTAEYITSLKDIATFEKIDFIALGRRGQTFLARSGQNVIGAFPAFSNHPKLRDIAPIAKMASEAFASGSYDHVALIYPDFLSALLQKPTVKVLLPFSDSSLRDMIKSLGINPESARAETELKADASDAQYIFEPSEAAVLDTVLNQITELQIYQALLEAVASEHSARMVAMRSATDNATALLDDLTLTYNQTRQANITSELAELSASKAALEA
jgi:F-type H+-transporting ATPase subunit gamma